MPAPKSEPPQGASEAHFNGTASNMIRSTSATEPSIAACGGSCWVGSPVYHGLAPVAIITRPSGCLWLSRAALRGACGYYEPPFGLGVADANGRLRRLPPQRRRPWKATHGPLGTQKALLAPSLVALARRGLFWGPCR